MTGARLRVVGTRQASIRGEGVTLTVRQGLSSDRQSYREESAVFQGEKGLALLSIAGPAASWDEAKVDALVASIR